MVDLGVYFINCSCSISISMVEDKLQLVLVDGPSKYWIYNLIHAFFFQNLNVYLRKTCKIVLFKALPI